MANENDDKTEAPTPKRREEARERGQIARSADLTSSLLLVGITVLLGMTGGQIVMAMRVVLERSLDGTTLVMTDRDLVPTLTQIGLTVGGAMAPLLVGTVVMAMLANLVQVGFHPSLKRVQPKLNLNPMAGLKRLMPGGGQGPVKFGMNLAKMGIVSFLAYSAIRGKIGAIVAVSMLDPLAIAMLCGGIVYDIVIRIGVFLLLLAIADFGYQKYYIEQQLKMSKQEVKDEMKNAEGDPMIKARRRQIAQQLAMKRMASEVPKADVIVTNPTHYAIALKYDADKSNAPKVVAKGMDLVALRIREIAAEHGIPIIERPPLARALYRLCDVGHEIPEQFYNAVAEILAYVYELTGKARRKVPA